MGKNHSDHFSNPGKMIQVKKLVIMLVFCFLLICSENNAQAISILDLHVDYHGLSTESSEFVALSNETSWSDTLSATTVDSSSYQNVSSPHVNMQTNAASAIVNNATASASGLNEDPAVWGNQWGYTLTGDLHTAIDGISNQFSYASLDLVYYMYFDHTYDPNTFHPENALYMQNYTEFNGYYTGDPLDSVKFSISSEVTIKNLTTGNDLSPSVRSGEVQFSGTGQLLSYDIEDFNDVMSGIMYDPQSGQFVGCLGGLERATSNSLANGDKGLIIERVHIDVSAGNPVPEPFTLLLVGSGLLGLAGFRKKLKR